MNMAFEGCVVIVDNFAIPVKQTNACASESIVEPFIRVVSVFEAPMEEVGA
jgi:hypothetical protein